MNYQYEIDTAKEMNALQYTVLIVGKRIVVDIFKKGLVD